MDKEFTILFTARDVNAALNIAPVAALASEQPDIRVRLAAEGPALDIFLARFPDTQSFRRTPDGLLDQAASLLRSVAPDAVVAGVSGPDQGIDEAILTVCAEDVQKFVFQDFWGDMNPVHQPRGETFLVADAHAAAITSSRGIADCAAVGWPKYDRYASLDIPALGIRAREALGADGRKVAGFFGQPLGHVPGYTAMAAAAARATASSWPDAVLLHRPHPRETREDVAAVREAFAEAGLPILDATALDAVESLCACDLVLTPFSSCGLDYLHLSSLSPEPLGAVMYLCLHPGLQEYFTNYTGLDAPPPLLQAMALGAGSREEATRLIAELDAACLERLWHATRNTINPSGGAAQRALEAILARCTRA